MTKDYQKHSTARLARCSKCQGEFSAIWGRNVVHALSGAGLCDSCKKTAEGAKMVTKPPPKKKKVKVKDGAETRPVQETSG